MGQKMVIGPGYLGKRVARRWREAGDEVYVTTRSAEKAEQLHREGFHPVITDVEHPQTLHELPSVATVLYSIGFDRAAPRPIEQRIVTGLRHTLDALSGDVQRFVFISTTGVYGQTSGEWVTEESTCYPARPSGRAYREAEQRVLTHRLGSRSLVLRMAGIYGPGRIPNLQKLQVGSSLRVVLSGYLNLIHVEDAADVVVAAADQLETPNVYLVSDGHPVLRQEYYDHVARLLGVKAQYDAIDPRDPKAGRSGGSKRIDTRKLQQALKNLTWQFPTFREGLADALGRKGKSDR